MASPPPPPHPHQHQQHPLPPHQLTHPQYQPPPPSIPPPASASAPPKALDLEVTVVSGKHLKNVNWRRGDLRAYAVAYLDPSRRTATRPDDAGGCKPAWNERVVLPLPPHLSPHDPSLLLSLDVFHSKPSDSPKPLVGSARSPLRDLLYPNPSSDSPASPIITLPLLRPSGRPQGKLRIRVVLRERSPPPPEPQYPPPSSSPYYFPSPPPPTYSAPPQYGLEQYYRPSPSPSVYYSAPPPPSQYEYAGGPSAPVEYGRQYEQGARTEGVAGQYEQRVRTDGVAGQYEQRARTEGAAGQYEQRARTEGVAVQYEQRGRTEGATASSGRYGLGTGLAVGAVAGAVGGLAIDEGVKYKEEKPAERVGEKVAPAGRDDYSEYRGEY